MHPQPHVSALSSQHYAVIATYFLRHYLEVDLYVLSITYFGRQRLINALLRLYPTEDEFNSRDESTKSHFSDILSSLVCIAHILPLACRSEKVLKKIFDSNCKYPHLEETFHGEWPLNGWCDHIIQPAQDAVLEYYKVRTTIST